MIDYLISLCVNLLQPACLDKFVNASNRLEARRGESGRDFKTVTELDKEFEMLLYYSGTDAAADAGND